MAKTSRWRRFLDLLGDIDTASNLPTWFTWVKAVTAPIVGGITVWVARAQEIPAAYVIPSALLAFGAVLLIWNQFYARKLQKQQAVIGSAAIGSSSAHQWLVNIAEQDKKGDAIICVGTFVQWHLDGTAPHAELKIMIWNSLVWPIGVEPSITGRIKCAGLEFPDPPEFMQPPPSGIPHAKGAMVTLRQSVSEETLLAMHKVSSTGLEFFDFDDLYLHSVIAASGQNYKRRFTLYSSFPVVLPRFQTGPVS